MGTRSNFNIQSAVMNCGMPSCLKLLYLTDDYVRRLITSGPTDSLLSVSIVSPSADVVVAYSAGVVSFSAHVAVSVGHSYVSIV